MFDLFEFLVDALGGALVEEGVEVLVFVVEVALAGFFLFEGREVLGLCDSGERLHFLFIWLGVENLNSAGQTLKSDFMFYLPNRKGKFLKNTQKKCKSL